ncbi:MAG: ATP-binding protein [Beijerinckiaceae bacterium]|nr:ATP-binding protein [Beijerinckiaceae bacterium]MCZ8298733.1 ATP-binding protein [Beijerinckiaceae bacterium]
MQNRVARELDVIERRLADQTQDRSLGVLVACSGARGTILADTAEIQAERAGRWSVGSLITLLGRASRIVGFVYEMQAEGVGTAAGLPPRTHVQIELVGEIQDNAEGRPVFRRGIREYPGLGAKAHVIRQDDLEAIYAVRSGHGAVIGALAQAPDLKAHVDLDAMLRQHFALVGSTGVGKSTSFSILMTEAIATRPNLRALILDPHNEFAAAFGKDAVVLDLRKLSFPCFLFSFEEFTHVLFRGREAPEGEIEFLREAITEAKEATRAEASTFQSGILKRQLRGENQATSVDAPSPYRLGDIVASIDEHLGRLEPRYKRSDLRSLKTRLDSLKNDPQFEFMFAKGESGDVLEDLLRQIFRIGDSARRITILQLAGVPADVVSAIVSVLARFAFETAMHAGAGYEIVLACEEAHRYIPQDERSAFGPVRRAIARIAKEGRKYGCYLGLISQRPSELDPTIFSQCSTIFAMRLANERDQDVIRSAFPDTSAHVLSFLAAIGNREAIAFGEALVMPMRMVFAERAAGTLPASNHAPHAEQQGLSIHMLVERLRGRL